jgi:hypothetical protein
MNTREHASNETTSFPYTGDLQAKDFQEHNFKHAEFQDLLNISLTDFAYFA